MAKRKNKNNSAKPSELEAVSKKEESLFDDIVENESDSDGEGTAEESEQQREQFDETALYQKMTAIQEANEQSDSEEDSSDDDDSSSDDDVDGLTGKVEETNISNKPVLNLKQVYESIDKPIPKSANSDEIPDEYAFGDSSDDEGVRNTIGDVPLEWYDDYDHIGYDVTGNKIYKPERGDQLDEWLKRMDDPNYQERIVDRLTGQDVQLVEGDLELVHRLVNNKIPSAQYDSFAPFLDLYSHEVEEMPRNNRPLAKKSFVPSIDERKKVSKMVHAIKTIGNVHKHRREKRYQASSIWGEKDTDRVQGIRRSLHPLYRAPPIALPTNKSSYNPPPEYLPSKKQLEWLDTKIKSEKDRKMIMSRTAQKNDTVRNIPNHHTYVQDTYNRCLDLFLSSRFAYRKIVGKSSDLLPNLPKPRDLRPWPSKEDKNFEGHRSIVRTISVHPGGLFLASGSDDHTVKIWEIDTGRCFCTLEVGDAALWVEWCPNPNVFLLAVAVGKYCLLINPESYCVDKHLVDATNKVFAKTPDQGDYEVSEKVLGQVKWLTPSDAEKAKGYRVLIKHAHEVTQVVWHPRGDYFATLQPGAHLNAIVTHQLARQRSQLPFSRACINVSRISFHPKRQLFYICGQNKVRIYSITEKKCKAVVKLQGNDTISSIAIHPSGEHFVLGTYEKNVKWVEMEYTKRPISMRHHHGPVRSVAIHKRYPLFASASDDGRVIVNHGKIYKDFLKDPLIVPVKELRNHAFYDGMCVLDMAWHPHSPHLFTAGADASIRMWVHQ